MEARRRKMFVVVETGSEVTTGTIVKRVVDKRNEYQERMVQGLDRM